MARTAVPGDPAFLGIDGVDIRATGVPEPGAACLLALVGAVAACRRRY